MHEEKYKQDILDKAEILLSKFIGDFYGVDKWETIDNGFSFCGTKCGAVEALKKMGFSNRSDLLCPAHEESIRVGIKSIDPNLNFYFAKTIGRGDDVCEFVVRLLKVSDPTQTDSLDTACKLMSEFIGELYGIDERDIRPNGFTLRATKCPGIEPMRELGMPTDTFCRGHEAYWTVALRDIDPNLYFEVPEAIGKGDSYCMFVVERRQPVSTK